MALHRAAGGFAFVLLASLAACGDARPDGGGGPTSNAEIVQAPPSDAPSTNESDDETANEGAGEASSSPTAPGGAPEQIRVVQCNPYYAGRLAPVDVTGGTCSASSECASSSRTVCTSATSADGCWECIDKKCRQRSWDTIEHAARLFSAIRADVVGLEELQPAFTPRIDAILESATRTTWDELVTEQGIRGSSGIGIFWRTSRIELVEDLGAVDVDTLSTGYVVRFRGAILRTKTTHKAFGFFAGKLFWESGASEQRTAEARRLRAWIDAKMAPWEARGVGTRILASDFNDVIDSGAYDVFADYDDGGSKKKTIPGPNPDALFSSGKRIDYLFWADSAKGASGNGFVTSQSDGRLGRSEYYGSDHRFVYGDALVR